MRSYFDQLVKLTAIDYAESRDCYKPSPLTPTEWALKMLDGIDEEDAAKMLKHLQEDRRWEARQISR